MPCVGDDRLVMTERKTKANISMLAAEIYDHIVSFVPTTAGLKSLSLVNLQFYEATRRFLFSRVVCSYYAGPHRPSTMWSDFVKENPSIGYHIRRLDLRDQFNKDTWHRLVTDCSVGASLHHISLQGLALPFPWDLWNVLAPRKRTMSFSQCGVPVLALLDVIMREQTLETVCIAEDCVLTGDITLISATSPACKLRAFHALSYGNGTTVLSFPYILPAIVAACEFVVELHIRIAPGQSDALARLLVAATCIKRLVIAFGPGSRPILCYIYGIRVGDQHFPHSTAVRDVSVALPQMTSVRYLRLEGSRIQARSMLSSLRNWDLSRRVGCVHIELFIFDLPLASREWEELSSTFLNLRAFRAHKLCLFVDSRPRWIGRVGYWLGWVSHGEEVVHKGNILLSLDLFM